MSFCKSYKTIHVATKSLYLHQMKMKTLLMVTMLLSFVAPQSDPYAHEHMNNNYFIKHNDIYQVRLAVTECKETDDAE